jgi:hypothetical protein
MDVDRLDEEGWIDQMWKGLCFHCHEHCHQAAKCLVKEKDKKKKILVHQEKIEEESEDEVKTHRLAEDS